MFTERPSWPQNLALLPTPQNGGGREIKKAFSLLLRALDFFPALSLCLFILCLALYFLLPTKIINHLIVWTNRAYFFIFIITTVAHTPLGLKNPY